MTFNTILEELQNLIHDLLIFLRLQHFLCDCIAIGLRINITIFLFFCFLRDWINLFMYSFIESLKNDFTFLVACEELKNCFLNLSVSSVKQFVCKHQIIPKKFIVICWFTENSQNHSCSSLFIKKYLKFVILVNHFS